MFFSKNILLVDDSSIIISLIKNILNEKGYNNVYTALNVEDGLNILKSDKVDLALLDYNMPEKNGDYLLDHIKEKYPNVPVIMLSGQQERDIVVKLMRKADNYIIKDKITEISEDLLFSIKQAFELQDLKEKNTKLIEEIKQRNESLEQQLNTAKHLLKDIYPKQIEKSAVFNISAHNWPWDIIGGDFYNIEHLDDNKIGILISDICGHGIQAALLLITLSNAYKDAIKDNFSAKAIIQKLNTIINKQFPEGLFVTCCYMILDEKNGQISFSSAFETPILYLKKDKTIEEVKNGKLPYIGLVKNNNHDYFEESIIDLKENEKLFIFTDGVIEAYNEKNELFDIKRVKEIICKLYNKSLDEIIQTIYQSAKNYSNNNIADDITIIGIEKKKK